MAQENSTTEPLPRARGGDGISTTRLTGAQGTWSTSANRWAGLTPSPSECLTPKKSLRHRCGRRGRACRGLILQGTNWLSR